MRGIKSSKIYGLLAQFMSFHFPKTYVKLRYWTSYGRRCNLENPKTFSEKLIWLSLNSYSNNSMVRDLSDKYLVRSYVKEKGLAKHLNELFKVYRSIEEIRFEDLPNSFVLKRSQGCGSNIIVPDKERMCRDEFYSEIKRWGQEMRLYDKKISNIGEGSNGELAIYYICEKFLRNGDDTLKDYKIYCFNGKPEVVLVIDDRFGERNGAFMSLDWDYLSDLGAHYAKPKEIYERPPSLQQMINVATILSEGFPFVRVDMYDVNGVAIFGEMTFFPAGCVGMSETLVGGRTMGDMLDIGKD